MLKEPKKYFAACNKDENVALNSSSGGVFYALANKCIKTGGDVFGSALTQDFRCKIVKATNTSELKPLLGSKYVLSNVANSFKDCLESLKKYDEGSCTHCPQYILFSGTPCQIVMLLNFLEGKISENQRKHLITVDVFCHGVPSQKLFSAYIKWLRTKHNVNLSKNNSDLYTFRVKPEGWSQYLKYSYSFTQDGSSKTIIGNAWKDPYYSAFLFSATLLQKCYKCPYSQKCRVGDISIGDFWGVEKHLPNFYNEHKSLGVSAVCINSENGEKFFARAKDQLFLHESNYQQMCQTSINENDKTVQKNLEEFLDTRKKVEQCLNDGEIDILFNEVLDPSKIKKLVIKHYGIQ